MTYYDIMFGAINEQYESGEITFEQAEELNQIAYDKYMTETSKETKAKRDEHYYGLTKKGAKIDKELHELSAIVKQTPNNIHEADNANSYNKILAKNKSDERLKNYNDDDLHKKTIRELKKYKDTHDLDDANVNKKSLVRKDFSQGSTIDYSSKSPNESVQSEARKKLVKKLEQPKNMLDHKREGYNFGVSTNKNDMKFFYTKKKK